MYAYDQVAGNYNNVRFARTDGAALGVGTGNDGVLADGVHYSDGAGSWRPSRLASGDNFVGSTDIPAIGIYGFDSVNFDRIRTSTVGDDQTVGLLATHLYAFDSVGANSDRVRSGTNGSDNVGAEADGNLNTRSFSYETDGSNFDRIRHSFTQTTADITTNAAGTSINETATPMSKHTMIVDRTAGATNVVDIRIECSIDDVDYVQIASITDLTNEPALVSQDGTACLYMRYNVATIGAGNTVQIHLLDTR